MQQIRRTLRSRSFTPSYAIISSGKYQQGRHVRNSSTSREQTEAGGNFFRYTSGRWLWNEKKQLEKRYVHFDISALQQIAGRVCGSRCIQMSKLQEGQFNKVFSLKMENGREILARIPNPNAGHSFYVVTSEVATLDFLRNVVDIPVPVVIASSSSLDDSPVGVNYILMERVKGRQLSDVWDTMSEAQRFELVKSLVEIERRLDSTTFAGYGSLYHKDIIQSDKATTAFIGREPVATSKFVLGPITERSFWEDEKRELDLDRGPWETAQEYVSAIVNREIAWLRKLQTSRRVDDLLFLGGSRMGYEKHIYLLERLLLVIPYILPAEDLVRPVLLHHDLHSDNIFVKDEDPTQISSIIDWQASYASPLFMQVRFPSIVDSDEPYPWGAVQPELPRDFETLSPLEKEKAKKKLDETRLKKFYELATRKFNPVLAKAMDSMRRDHDPTTFIFHIVGQSSSNGPIPLQALLIQNYEKWDWIAERRGLKVPCPISFSKEDIDHSRWQAQEWANIYAEFDSLRTQILGHEGWVPHEDYEEAKVEFENHRAKLEDLRQRLESLI